MGQDNTRQSALDPASDAPDETQCSDSSFAVVGIGASAGGIQTLKRIYELGEGVLSDENRCEINPAYERQLSVFQLGWRLLRRLISCAEPPLCTLYLRPCKSEPVWLDKY